MNRGRVAQEAATTQIYVFPSTLGWFAVDWHAAQLQALVFGYTSGAEAAGVLLANVRSADDVCWLDVEQNPTTVDREVRRLAERLQAYADGQRDEMRDIPVASDGVTPFQRQVLQQCRRIGYGKTRTYGELAAKAGFPQAARAVGSVMARNRVPLVIPCHRVVGSSGTLRGYSGCGGTAMKQRLLELEGAR
jgi:methylated-DNA-[protein]-cysteine S-methyltransferase